MLHQVEFLLEGNLLPMTIGEFEVSDHFLLETVYPKSSGDNSSYAVAYVATEEEGNYFRSAIAEVEFFILIYALVSGQHVTSRTGIGTELQDLSSLGKKRFAFPNYEKIHVIATGKDEFWTKPILETKELFLKLLPQRQKIMNSHLGLALIYYYIAVQASQRRFDQAIINLMIALEALVIKEGDSIRNPISRRVSALIEEDPLVREETVKKMSALYDLRSAIVHGRGKKPTFSETKQLFGYAQRAIEKALSFRHLSKEELAKTLDEE